MRFYENGIVLDVGFGVFDLWQSVSNIDGRCYGHERILCGASSS
jgi:hypothetical protein